ncbi:MAG: DinB family protein [Acidobacteriota bacterium]
MVGKPLPEVWMRGPVPGIPALLQPVAHSLLQCQEELHAHLAALQPAALWARPGGAAAVGFHVRHAAGSLDRLFTYARGEALSPAQYAALKVEGDPDLSVEAAATLLSGLDAAIEAALAQLRRTGEETLLEPRGVGRARLPSTVLGLLFHAAEHTQRHAGQAVTTARIIAAGEAGR